MCPDLIDKIYESAVVPDVWPEVLDELSRVGGSLSCSLFVTRKEVIGWKASPRSQAATERFVKEGWFFRGRIAARMIGANHPGFLTDVEVLTTEEIAEEPIYKGIWGDYGAAWAVATAIPIPTGELVSFVLPSPKSRGPVARAFVDRLDALRPHLARSALIAARLQLERARVMSEALGAIGLAAAVLDENGKVIAANPLIEAMTGHIIWRAGNRLSLKDKSADRFLHDAIPLIALGGAAGVRSFPVRDAVADATMVAHIVPVRLSARDIFARSAAVLVLTSASEPQAPPVELVQSLFDLTPAEARVARRFASGATIDDVSGTIGISRNTVRAHLRSIMGKTGCKRQAEIVALLSGIPSLSPG